MSTTVWRIGFVPSPQPAIAAILGSLGYGSTLANGRWHTKGPAQIVYAGSSRALCQLEKRVHCNGANPANQALMRLELPARSEILHAADLGLPKDWHDHMAATQSIGMNWLASGASLGLWVPSFVERDEMNLLINLAHSQYGSIRLVVERNPFEFDPRLF